MKALEWLLAADPAVRWQALRDLTDASAVAVAAERHRVATAGWGARLLALRREDGLWDRGTPDTEWITLLALVMLRDMGVDASSEQARNAVALVRDNATWHNPRAPWNGRPVFAGEVEPCINGRVVTVGAYFGQDVTGIVERLLGEQMADGGWNCEQENGSTRGSFHTTIDVLEGLLEHARATGGSTEVSAALERGQEYLLERRMLRRLSSAELTEKRRGVEIRAPPLRLSIFVVDDEGHWHLHGLVRGRDACEFAALSPRHRALPDHGVALRHGALNFVVDVGQTRPQRGVECAEAGLVHGSDHRVDERHIVSQVCLETVVVARACRRHCRPEVVRVRGSYVRCFLLLCDRHVTLPSWMGGRIARVAMTALPPLASISSRRPSAHASPTRQRPMTLRCLLNTELPPLPS